MNNFLIHFYLIIKNFEGSNCSGYQTNSTSGQTMNKSNRQGGNYVSGFLYQIFCACFMPTSTEMVSSDQTTFNKHVKHSQSFSTNSRNFNDTAQSPLCNYSSSLTGHGNSFTKTINDEDCINLLQSEPCYNCQNIMFGNGLNQNKQVLNR